MAILLGVAACTRPAAPRVAATATLVSTAAVPVASVGPTNTARPASVADAPRAIDTATAEATTTSPPDQPPAARWQASAAARGPATATASPTRPPGPSTLNDIPVADLLYLPPPVQDNVRQIMQRGLAAGRDLQRFSKLGDSLIATPHSFTVFDSGGYDLGPFAHLDDAIGFYSGSFARYGVAVKPGLHSYAVFDPLWANKEWCLANESPLECELRLNNPGLMLIFLGTNDAGYTKGFTANLQRLVETLTAAGVVPVLATKADRFEGPDNSNNLALRALAADYQLPLWDFDRLAETLPQHGLGEDGVHLSTFPSGDYSDSVAYERGYAMHNLLGLLMLADLRALTVPLLEE